MQSLSRTLFSLLALAVVSPLCAQVPPGYYAPAEGLQDEALKTALCNITGHHSRIAYGSEGTWTVFRTSDVRPDGSIWDMYSDVVRYFPETGAHPDMNIEHSVPKSWWGDTSPFIYDASYDLHHLVPADAAANIAKSNNIPGEVQEVVFDNGVSRVGKARVGQAQVSVFEPADEYKGDFARMYMYVATCYQDYAWMADGTYMFDSEPYPTLTAYASELLMRWHRQDPVSDKETARNEAVYAAQHNRNPFIDYPLLAEYLWGDSIGRPFYSGAAADPYLVTPERGTTIDMGTVMQGGSLDYELDVQAMNLLSPLSVSWKNGAGIVADPMQIDSASAAAGVRLRLSYRNDVLTGVLRDTLYISGGGLYAPLSVPVAVHGTSRFVTLPATDVAATAATLQWVACPGAETYDVTVWRGASEATDLFVSAYVEGSSYNKALVLYNGTAAAVRLSDYGIARQQNGYGDYDDYTSLPDVWLQPHDTYVMVNSSCTNTALLACADWEVPSGENSPLNFNGNDAVALYHGGVLIDAVGYAGMAAYWGQDITLYRNTTVVGPSATFDMQQWEQAPADDFSRVEQHTITSLVDAPAEVASLTVAGEACRIEGLQPLTTYTYAVEAVTTAGSVPADSRGVLVTTDLTAPLLRQPGNVTGSSFVARWEEVEGAEAYELACFTLVGDGSVTVTEGFDAVGTSGKPLPDGWTGNASGNYTSTASSGEQPPSVALKNDAEYIESPRYDSAVTALTFMYRFASQATGSSLTVEKLGDDEWTALAEIGYENTSKHTATYAFDSSENVRAFRFTYHKVKGNIALDDVCVQYGKYDTLYVEPGLRVQDTEAVIEKLASLTTYYYRVASLLGGYRSPWSMTGMVVTDAYNAVPAVTEEPCRYSVADGVLTLYNLPDGSRVTVYSLHGVPCAVTEASGNTGRVVLPGSGFYIVQVTGATRSQVIKVICR